MADGAFKEIKKTKQNKKKIMENVLKKYLRTSGAIRPRSVDDMRCVPGTNI